jgi:hypothetical protein
LDDGGAMQIRLDCRRGGAEASPVDLQIFHALNAHHAVEAWAFFIHAVFRHERFL